MEEKMDETVHKSVHDALIMMDLGTILDRLDKRMTELVDRVTTMETHPPQQQPLLPQQQPPPRHQQPPHGISNLHHVHF
jgi:hypothetical protein